eukprot:jgi/Ulvmu1/5863/UM025_0125.1
MCVHLTGRNYIPQSSRTGRNIVHSTVYESQHSLHTTAWSWMHMRRCSISLCMGRDHETDLTGGLHPHPKYDAFHYDHLHTLWPRSCCGITILDGPMPLGSNAH